MPDEFAEALEKKKKYLCSGGREEAKGKPL